MPKSNDILKDINHALDKGIEAEKRYKELLDALPTIIGETISPVLSGIYNKLEEIPTTIRESIGSIRIQPTTPNVPDIHIPEIKVPNVIVPPFPEQKQPIVNVEAPIVNVPEAKITVKVPKNDDVVKAMKRVEKAISEQKPIDIPQQIEYTRKKPMPVLITDVKGDPWTPMSGGSRSVANMLKNSEGLTASFGSGSEKTALRVVHASDFGMTVAVSGITGSVGATLLDGDGNYRDTLPTSLAQSVEVKQVSGLVDSVNVTSSDVSFEVKQVSGTSDSVSITGFNPTAPTNATTTAYDNDLSIKTSAGTLYGISGYNSSTSAVFLLLMDSASQPNDGVAGKVVITVPPLSNFSYDAGFLGRSFASGIFAVSSTTSPTKTLNSSSDLFIDAQYV